MPLTQGYSPDAISANIAELTRHGHPTDQSAAIAYKTARTAYQRRHPREPLPAHLQRNPVDLDQFVRAKQRTNGRPVNGMGGIPEDIDMEQWATSDAAGRYREAHWGHNPTKVHTFRDDEIDPYIPKEMPDMGDLHELRIVLGETPSGSEKIGTIKIPRSPKSLVAFSTDKAERVYLMLPTETKRKMPERLFLPGTETYPLQTAAKAAGGRQCEWKFPPVRVQVLGYCSHIVYHADKLTDGPGNYIHEFGEESGIRPFLCVDHKGRLWLAGGDYGVMPGGIYN